MRMRAPLSHNQRRDFAMPPPRPTVFDHLRARGLPVVGVGKVSDIFSGRGVSETIHTQGNTDGVIKLSAGRKRHALIQPS